MDKNTALLIIGLDPAGSPETEKVELAIEEAVFREASFFMRRALIPKLVSARINRVRKIAQAAQILNLPFETGQKSAKPIDTARILKPENFTDLLKRYNAIETEIKLHLANAENPYQIIDFYKDWKRLFLVFRCRFIELFERRELKLDSLEPPEYSLTTPADFNLLISEIRNENYTALVYSEYLRLSKLGD